MGPHQADETRGDGPQHAPGTRRSFLSRSLATASLALPAVAIASATGVAASPKLGKALPQLYRGQNSALFHEIQDDENTHVAFLQEVLGANARPKPTFQNLNAKTYQQFAAMSAAFENTGAGAYQGATPVIFSRARLAAAAQLAFVEAFHSGWLNSLIDQPLVPGGSPFSPALTIDEVVAAVSPYLASLNGGPPAAFDPANPSDANDTKILNFALILEYLEQEFYNINVPVFFP